MRAATTAPTVLGGHGLFAVKDEFHAFMRGDETEPLVEAMRVGADPAQEDGGRTYVQRGQHIHATSVP